MSGLEAVDLARLDAGLLCFNEERFWDAHEAWEEAWLEAEGTTKVWWQGLIQLTAAFHKGLRMGSPSGMATLFAHAAEKFERVLEEAPMVGGLNTANLLLQAQSGEALAQQWIRSGRSPWHTASLPKLNRHPSA